MAIRGTVLIQGGDMQSYERLEVEWAEFNGVDPKGMVVCSSGTAALHLAFESLFPKSYGVVSTHDYNMIACPRAIELADLNPRFYPRTDISDCRVEVASLQTWVYGRKPELISESSNPVVVDLAEAHGVKLDKYNVLCWSFYQNKIVCGEEGGSVYFEDAESAKVARELRSLGFDSNHNYTHRPRGHNYRLANRLADPIRLSIQDYEENAKARWDSWFKYHQHLRKGNDGPNQLYECPKAPWVYEVRIDEMTYEIQDRVVKTLKDAGIAARHGFKPMTMQPEFRGYGTTHPDVLKRSMETFYLPLVKLNNVPLDYGTHERAAEIVKRELSL